MFSSFFFLFFTDWTTNSHIVFISTTALFKCGVHWWIPRRTRKVRQDYVAAAHRDLFWCATYSTHAPYTCVGMYHTYEEMVGKMMRISREKGKCTEKSVDGYVYTKHYLAVDGRIKRLAMQTGAALQDQQCTAPWLDYQAIFPRRYFFFGLLID